MKNFAIACVLVFFTSCVSTKSTLKNIDNTAKRPVFTNEMYVITNYAADGNYAYDADYPINIGFIHEKQESINVQYFFNGLEGPNGEKINFKKIENCCPFPTKNTTMGAGTLSIYEVTFEGNPKKLTLYFNTYEKGEMACPKGFKIKKRMAFE
jgi:hypothetical protein